jgi:argininosuccinate lyase
MPQKKNPDFAELIRGKTGRVAGSLVALLMVMKALPLAYNKDMQEDKEGTFDAAKTLEDSFICMSGMIATMQVNSEAMGASVKKGFLAATDVADYLAAKGMPFRQAHEVVGNLVLTCEKRACSLEDLTLEDFQTASELFEADIMDCLTPSAVVGARTTFGGTAPEAVATQLKEAKRLLAAL